MTLRQKRPQPKAVSLGLGPFCRCVSQLFFLKSPEFKKTAFKKLVL
ncbi:hypothetical protein HPTD01_1066 [Halomonas sp. TD01]|nr:hypothetical protein HPTD01_1066 [Halomonas sp. TD01]